MKNLLLLFFATGFLMGCGTYTSSHFAEADDLYYNPADDAAPQYVESTVSTISTMPSSRTSELAPAENMSAQLTEDMLYRKYMYELENDTLLSLNDTLLHNGDYVVTQKKELQANSQQPVVIYNDNRNYGRSSGFDDDYYNNGSFGFNNYYDSWYSPFGYNSMYWGSNGWGLSFGSPYYSPYYSPFYGGHYHRSSFYGYGGYYNGYGNAYYYENKNTKYVSSNHREGRRLSQSSTDRLRNTGSTQFDRRESRIPRSADVKKNSSDYRQSRSSHTNQTRTGRSSRSVFDREPRQSTSVSNSSRTRTSYDNSPRVRNSGKAVESGNVSRTTRYTNTNTSTSTVRPRTSRANTYSNTNKSTNTSSVRPNTSRTNTYTNTTRTSRPARTSTYSNSTSTRTSRPASISTNTSPSRSSYTPSSSSSSSSRSSSSSSSSSSRSSRRK